jgi:PhnB protein
MPKRSLNPGNNGPKKTGQKAIEQLNLAVESMLARNDGKFSKVGAGIEPLARIAAELRSLPRQSFKERLKSQLLQGRTSMPVAEPVVTSRSTQTYGMPQLTVKNAAEAIAFYEKALGAVETFRFEAGGSIPHAEIRIGETLFGISDEWVEGGRLSAETWGHSPVTFRIHVPDVDAFAARAVAAGMRVKMPLTNQFYGYREGNFVDPFGYTWSLVTVQEEMSVEEMHRRMQGLTSGPEGGQMPAAGESRMGINPIPPGYSTVTAYLVAQDANGVVDFVKKTFGGEETFRAVGSAGGYHVEVRVDDSMLMIGGGGAGVAWKGEPVLGAFHVYVRDCDAAYQRALQAGGKSLTEPADQEYGERTASVIDAAGNHWYIATFKDSGYKSEGAPAIQPYMHPLRAEPVISFLKRAFAAEELGRYTSPDGVVHHTTLKIGTSQLEMGEAHGPYQPMKSMYYLYVPDVDAVYRTALAAGAKSIKEPAEQPYGDRVGAVTDIFGNQWWISTHVKDVKP